MLKSGIILAGAGKARRMGIDEGIVTAQKLLGLNLKGTDIVVLSACQTGVVDINNTDVISGLNKAFIQAGAKSVISTLWLVADKQSARLVTDFYKNVSLDEKGNKNNGYSISLREAKLAMIKDGMHPFFWAGFILTGMDAGF